MKKFARYLLVPALLFIIFTFLPTGYSSDEVLEGYKSTTSFSKSSSSYLLYMTQFQLVQEEEHDAEFSGSTGQKIAQFAIMLCEELGNGGNTSYRDSEGRKVGQFRYNRNSVAGYDTSEALRHNVQAMLRDETATCNISCCGFATFCWETLLTGRSPYGTSCTSTVSANFQDLIEGDGTARYIEEHAQPGDLLFYTTISGTTPPAAVGDAYKHTEVYIGKYVGVDARGNSYEIEYACAGSNEPTGRRDACIKPLSMTVSNKHVYLVPLSKWISSGNTPVNNSDTIEEIIEGEN